MIITWNELFNVSSVGTAVASTKGIIKVPKSTNDISTRPTEAEREKKQKMSFLPHPFRVFCCIIPLKFLTIYMGKSCSHTHCSVDTALPPITRFFFPRRWKAARERCQATSSTRFALRALRFRVKLRLREGQNLIFPYRDL